MMKKFAKKTGGKVLVFILCLLFTATALGGALLAAVLVSGDFYTRTEQEVIDEVSRSMVCGKGEELVFAALYAEGNTVPPYTNSNLCYEVTNSQGKVLLSYTYGDAEPTYFYSMSFTYHNRFDETWLESAASPSNAGLTYTVRFAFAKGLPVHDEYYYALHLLCLAYSLRYAVFPIVIVALALAIFCFLLLMAAAGRHSGDDDLHPGALYGVPFDLLLVAVLLIAVVMALPFGELSDFLWVELAAAYTVACIGVVLALCMSISTRCKGGTLWRNTLLGRLIKLTGHGIAKIPLVWRAAALLLALGLGDFIVLVIAMNSDGFGLFLWLIKAIVLFAAGIYLALCLRRLRAGGEALAAGNLNYRTDTGKLPPDLKAHAENLNSIALGMNKAVEERLKSERMKTELITNVSHDLKTPLTSVINYADLISKEPCDNEKITEYAQVLTRQSDRLRRLIEDLVEASKASTGNLEVNLAPCDAAVFLEQAAGEYTQRLADCGLTLETGQPEKSLRIMADGRRMWRIFDNLMNNIRKYAQSGTRVYLTLEEMSGSAVITFKNISHQKLNISEAELMERFVRADSSRSTEGNGLGLSIARSLAELQGGSLRLFIDGDLFKAILIFPLLGDANG